MFDENYANLTACKSIKIASETVPEFASDNNSPPNKWSSNDFASSICKLLMSVKISPSGFMDCYNSKQLITVAIAVTLIDIGMCYT